MMVPEFDEAAFSMKVGDVSDIIETQFGYHIIYKTDHEPAGEPIFHRQATRSATCCVMRVAVKE